MPAPASQQLRRPSRRWGRILLWVLGGCVLAYLVLLFWPAALLLAVGWGGVAGVRAVRRRHRLHYAKPRPGTKLVEPLFSTNPLLTMTLGAFSCVVLLLIVVTAVAMAAGKPPPLPRDPAVFLRPVVILAGLFAAGFACLGVWGIARLVRATISRCTFADLRLEVPRGDPAGGDRLDFRIVGPLHHDAASVRDPGLLAALVCRSVITWTTRSRRGGRRERETNVCESLVTRIPIELMLRVTDDGPSLQGSCVLPARGEVEAAIRPRSSYARARRMARTQKDFSDEWAWSIRLDRGWRRAWFALGSSQVARS